MMLAVLLASATAWAGEKMKRQTKWRKQWLIALLFVEQRRLARGWGSSALIITTHPGFLFCLLPFALSRHSSNGGTFGSNPSAFIDLPAKFPQSSENNGPGI